MFKPRYEPKEQTPEEMAAAEQGLQRIRQAAKIGWQRNLQAIAALKQQQEQDAEAARIAAEAASNTQPAPADTVPIEGLHFVNGRIVNKPEVAPSAAVAKVQQFSDWNEHARQNVRR